MNDDHPARVSIAINNHNYAQFLGAAIDSALAQSYSNIEVIVVDDGSTDASWELISRYGERITAVASANLGQGSAYNLGFERCTGQWVLFLDSDDVLDVDAVKRFLAAIDDNTSIVQCRLRKIDAAGELLGGMVPYTMHSGNVTPIIRRFGHYAGPPASGNFYRRSAIASYFPMPASAWRRAADTVPFVLGAFHGRVVSLPEALGSYRQHRRTNARIGLLGNMNRSIAEGLHNQRERRRYVFDLLRERSGIDVSGPFEPLPWSVRERALCWRLEPEVQPIDGVPESFARLVRAQWRSVSAWPGYGWADRLLQCAWTAAVAVAPRPALLYLARGNTSGHLRTNLRRVFSRAPRTAVIPASPTSIAAMNAHAARVTIAISSYNYERFVAQTIESALAQTYPNVEVIVVDDGSTDGSWAIIQRYGERISAVRSANRGQGSAYNIGFERSSGDWVLFLDSDDMLHPNTVERCLAAVRDDTSIVEFRLRLIDANSQPLGNQIPYTMHSGDVTPIIRRFGTYAGPPSCGNFYRRSAIAPCFPVPAERWRGSVDTVPFIVGAFHGQVVSLPEALASYRLHRASSARMGLMGNMSQTMTEELLMQQSRQREVLALLRERSGIDIRGPFLPLPWHVRARALAWRLEPDRPPVDGPESAMRLIRDQWRSVRAWPGYGLMDQLLQCAWTAAVALLPRLALAPLARSNASSGLRANLRRLFARAQ